jgi:hypothetical protein
MKYNTLNTPRTTLLKSVAAGLAAAGIVLCGVRAQAQPAISAIYPDGLHQFEAASTLSFTATSSSGVTSVQVTLQGTSLPGQSSLNIYSSSSGLTIVGSANNETVSAPLTSNLLYAATIQATDSGGTTTKTVSFDTITPSYTFEAEDWDYTNSAGVSGQFFDNPQTNQYAGLGSASGFDCLNDNPGGGGDAYRPKGMETQVTGDLPRLPYLGAGNTNVDYEIGYTSTGNFSQYTRNYPAGLYNVYARLSDGSGNNTDAASMTVASGTAQLLGAAPFTFADKNTGWSSYAFYSLRDANGALVQLSTDGTQQTLQFYADTGSYNANFFLFLPADTNVLAASATEFTNIYPDGATQFQPSTNLTFTVTNSVGVEPGNVIVLLNGTNLLGQSFSTAYTSANGLIATGPETNLDVSIPLQSNTTYSVYVQITDNNGNAANDTWSFDTITPAYTWEAEDYDYGGGLFITSPQTNQYYGLAGVPEIDYYVDDPTSGGHSYRAIIVNNVPEGPDSSPSGDVPRVEYTNAAINNPLSGFPYEDYEVGYNDGANWRNYTGNYPDGTFNVYIRVANGNGGSGSEQLNLVTGGLTTSNQTVTPLGTFNFGPTGGWSTYAFAPLKDSSGNLSKVTFSGGGPETLKITEPGSDNDNFYMLVPADTTLPVVTGLYPNGAAFFQQTNRLTFTASSSLGIAASNILVTVNGSNVSSTLTLSGSSDSWFVSYPLQNNVTYNVSISITANGGLQYNQSIVFDTYSPTYYTWESGDYDYTGSNGVAGQFFDNPQIDAYAGLGATPGIDEQEVTAGAPLNEDLYRTNTAGTYAGDIVICTQAGADLPRAQFGTNATWRINWFGFGDFANYTRHYPAGSYNVLARFTEGGAATYETLWMVTNGLGTTNQQTEFLGEWTVPVSGWETWEWETLMTTNAIPTPAVVTFNGSTNTLQLGSTFTEDGQNANVGFFMLVPAAPTGTTLTASVSAGNITISFPTATGKSYQVVYKSNLSATTWTPIGSPLAGNNAVQSVQYSTAGSQGFYTVQIQ